MLESRNEPIGGLIPAQTNASPSLQASASHADQNAMAGPGAFWLGAGFILAGIGTVMLGPLLPWLSAAWALSDAQGGTLLAVKFVGSFLGGFTVLPRLRLGILLGALVCFAGFSVFALSSGFLPGSLGLFAGGYGLGQLIAATNILVGRRYEHHTGSALALLNVFWSLGAVLTGLLAASLLPRFGMRGPMLAFSSMFLLTGAAGALLSSRRSASSAGQPTLVRTEKPLPSSTLLYFAALLLLYGGLETSISGWLTTYTLRFSHATWLGGQSAIVLLWSALTLGRAFSSLAMRRWSEAAVRALGLLLATFALLLLLVHLPPMAYLACCVVLGLSLAPFFPATFARLLQHQPTARVSGRILAVSGLGAALFPWLVGVVSTHTGSLRLALIVPLLLTAALFVLGFVEPGTQQLHSERE